MTSEIAADILRDQTAMESQRFNHDTTNQRIADLIWPASGLFVQKFAVEGQRRDQFAFDATGCLALGRFAAAVESIITPSTQRWHGLGSGDPAFDKIPSVKRYFEAATNVLFNARYAAESGFAYASSEGYQSLGAFGNQCLFLDDDPGRTLRYKSVFVGNIWIGLDHVGRVDRVHRKLTLTARQAKQKFQRLPDLIDKAAEKNPNQEFDFIHCVKRNDGLDPTRRDYRGMAFASYYISTSQNDLLEIGGYRTMPYLFSRFTTAPGEIYGRGPASQVLPTLNTINEQQKTLLRAGQRAVDPPIMLVDDDALEGFNMKSSALNRGFLSADGTPLAVPFNSGAELPIGLEFVQDSREIINDAFFVTLFRILAEQPEITATEALLRAQEKGELLGPSVGRQKTEYLSPMVGRELDLLSQVPGLLPDMPPELQEVGGFTRVKFTGPLDRLQRSGDGAAMLRWLESMSPVAQIKPEVLNVADWPKFARELADIQGVPASVMLDEDQQAEVDDAQAQQAQAAALLQAAPIAGKAALDFSKAQQLQGAQAPATALL